MADVKAAAPYVPPKFSAITPAAPPGHNGYEYIWKQAAIQNAEISPDDIEVLPLDNRGQL